MSGYKTVDFFHRGKRKLVVCSGPEGPSALTTIYNCVSLNYFECPENKPLYVEESAIKDALNSVLNNSFQALLEAGDETPATLSAQKEHLRNYLYSPNPNVLVKPQAGSICSFLDNDFTWLVTYLAVILVHGWVLDPGELGAISNKFELSTREDLQMALVNKKLGPKTRNMIQDLLNAVTNRCTSHGYLSLCKLPDGACAVYYCNEKFNVIHKNDTYLLILETDQGVLDRFPGVTWRVFEKVEGVDIYLTSEYSLVSNQPNLAEAQRWFKCNGLSNKELSDGPGDNAAEKVSRSKRRRDARRLKKQLAKEQALRDEATQSVGQGDEEQVEKELGPEDEPQGDEHQQGDEEQVGEQRQGDEALPAICNDFLQFLDV